MKNKKLTYEELTDLLKNTSPVLKHPEELTQTIMSQIESIAKNKKKYRLIHITGLLSGAIACLLLCLLAYEPVQISTYQHDKTKISVNLSDKERIRNISNTNQSYSVKDMRSGIKIISEKLKEKSKRKDIKARIFTASFKQDNNRTINL
ncbi:MAG: hypothetical protein LBG80_20075 [Bacteroidales bacterium]|jgi:hypothetical protein|nr:hypothetical protein [Bacteroidales bacterium]